ncbi:protein phosphatase 1 regulatory subunit 12A-like isoform X2 [Daphnia pulex]|uniref:protein phosphatase 1 regulatory subunit 12A-like isoform X2 n=1 Tax=Daphnia pulex TaxID=6669 RepID=UPI001EDFCD71|nr:protein phosphatase 1 regulatory subunit 12A-like isoform X2 [Daphnia pulex]
MESRTNSALFKRAEQLRRWEESETNKEPASARVVSRRIQFSDGCVFLSACAAGDKEEVLKLIRQGADIDTPNVDGLTALHQACIDDNLDMVEFLVEHGADINRGDHEGWTPLHATASCGFLSIARYLIENKSDVAAVNNDGELPIDIAETEAMEELLERETQLRGIDCDAARSQEERQMLADTSRWLEGDPASARLLQPHPRTGATPLHVASAKGYIRVMSMLVQGGGELNIQDIDGWTPLHAAAHWGQREACQLLCENMADMEVRNYVGQTCFDVADPDIIRLLEECKKRQAIILRERPEVYNNRGNARNQSPPKRRSSVTRTPQTEKAAIQASSKITDKVPGAVIMVDEEKENSSGELSSPVAPLAVQESFDERAKPATTPATTTTSVPTSTKDNSPRVTSSSGPPSRPPPPPATDVDNLPSSPSQQSGQMIETEEDVPSWRRPGSFRSRQAANAANGSGTLNHTPVKSEREGLNRSISQPLTPVAAVTSSSSATPQSSSTTSSNLASTASSISSSTSALSTDTEVTLRRAHSFESDERFYSRLLELRRRIKANSLPLLAASSLTPIVSGGSNSVGEDVNGGGPTSTNTIHSTNNRSRVEQTLQPDDDLEPVVLRVKSRLGTECPVEQTTTATLVLSQPNVPSSANQPIRRSFVPPVRDEESETQRKAHAKRVRETRRSTQGVTLEEVKTAEQLAKKKQAETTSIPASVTPDATESTDSKSELERRPSWRLCINDNNKNKFSLEDSRSKNNGGGGVNASSTITSITADTVITIPLRRSKAQEEEMKETTKENAAAATPATIQRRRRPKRRSTGVVQIDMEDFDPSGKDNTSSSQTGDSEPHSDDSESLSDRGSSSRQVSRPSSLGSSISDVRDEAPAANTQPSTPITTQQQQPTMAAAAAAVASGAMTPNGDIDYKKLWEESQVENERLRDRLRSTHEELAKCKDQLDNAFQVSNARNAMTEAEKRERRALERKLSEMEEELKQLQKLKAENEKLKAENRALTRVVSKLTANAALASTSSSSSSNSSSPYYSPSANSANSSSSSYIGGK